MHHLFLVGAFQVCLCSGDVNVIGVGDGAYIVSVLFGTMIVFSEDKAKLARAARWVDSACDIRREIQMVFFKPRMYSLISVTISHLV